MQKTVRDVYEVVWEYELGPFGVADADLAAEDLKDLILDALGYPDVGESKISARLVRREEIGGDDG